MTKEELKQEAEEYARPWKTSLAYVSVKDAYFAGAESREKRIAELEKENAELKGIKDVATLIRANNDTVITLMQLNNKLVSKSQQLTKAKDHIKKLLDCLKQDTNDPQTNYYVCQYMDKAEQFLKDSEVEK
jgi:uncharacterized coiled-coil protein SlyX